MVTRTEVEREVHERDAPAQKKTMRPGGFKLQSVAQGLRVSASRIGIPIATPIVHRATA
jgi:hypothetical protein